jgi:aryl-alcohol dehydrogenase-like predicted oxidoreductase
MMQNHYSLLYREEEREMIPLCVEEGVGLIPWGPLAAGRLAGSREAGTTRSKSGAPLRGGSKDRFNRPEDEAVVTRLREVAAQRGETPAQVAIAWLLSKPGMTAPIVGASKLHQLDDPIRAVDTVLSAEENQAAGGALRRPGADRPDQRGQRRQHSTQRAPHAACMTHAGRLRRSGLTEGGGSLDARLAAWTIAPPPSRDQ